MQKKNYKIYCYVDDYNLSDLLLLGKNINIIYRNYKDRLNLECIIKLKKYCKNKGYKLYISNDIKLSIKLGLDGIYIPSFNRKINYLQCFSLPKKFKVVGSAHSIPEINLKIKQKCSEIFLSPTFSVSKSKKFLGIIKFNYLTLNKKFNYIALGGVNEKNYKMIKLLNAEGFASISWAKKNGLRKLRPF